MPKRSPLVCLVIAAAAATAAAWTRFGREGNRSSTAEGHSGGSAEVGEGVMAVAPSAAFMAAGARMNVGAGFGAERPLPLDLRRSSRFFPAAQRRPGYGRVRSSATATPKPALHEAESSEGTVVSFARKAGNLVLKAAGVVAGLMALLYLTRGFEGVCHKAGDLLAGRSPLAAGALGLAVGTLHTFAGPDHLAGLAPLIIGQRRSPVAAFGLGALWGSGHATGQLLIGLGCLAVQIGLVRLAWAPAFGQFSGFLVGASLVAIGLLGFHEAREFEEEAAADGGETKERGRFGWATYATGVLHGLSLDAIIFITPALALPRIAAAFHVAGVVGGTLLSMGAYTSLLSAVCRRSPRLQIISAGASSVAILLGVLIVFASLGISIPLPGLD